MKRRCFTSFFAILAATLIFPPFAAAGPVSGPARFSAVNTDLNRDGSQHTLRTNKATGEVDVWQVRGGALLSEQQIGISCGPARELVGEGDFNGEPGLLFWTERATVNITVRYMHCPFHLYLNAIAVRAPPSIGAEGRYFQCGVLSHINWRHIAIPFVNCPPFLPGTPRGIISYSLFIRAPPMVLLYSC